MTSSAQASLIKRLGPPTYRGKYQRNGVISPSLCDDIIKRLAPSLTPYIGGTIIDQNPGSGLFSTKIHDFLKPKNHILLEPYWKKHAPYLQPLLDAPGSRYHHRDWADSRVRQVEQFEAEGWIPGPGDHSNHATLHILNTCSSPTRASSASAVPEHISSASDFALEAKRLNTFHARGPSRMLLWCEDEKKKPILPRTVDARRRLAFYLEAYCHVNEVVGFGAWERGSQRQQDLIIASSKMARQRMKDNDIYTPPNREAPAPEETPEGEQIISRYWHEELRHLEAGFAAGKLSQYIGWPPAPLKPYRLGFHPTAKPSPEFDRLRYLRRWWTQDNKDMAPALELADEQEAIDALDLQSHDPALTPTRRREMHEELDARTAALHATLTKWYLKKSRRFYYLSDDRHAMRMQPGPLLMWDRRAYEPLTAAESEFHPKGKVTLLDLQYKDPKDILPTESRQQLYFDLLGQALTQQQGPSNLQFLKQIIPGGYETLVPKVAEFRDIREGGRRCLEDVRLRFLTPKLIWRLAVEWDRWPFKPELKDVLGLWNLDSDDGRRM